MATAAGNGGRLPAQTIRGSVPGDLITDLQAASLVGDPLFELNFKNATMWDTYVWTYATTFEVGAALLERLGAAGGSRLLLVFDGVKMGAAVRVNGELLGRTTDQFLRYEFPLAASVLLKGGTPSATARTRTRTSTSDRNVTAHSLTVEFSPTIDCEGRWMGCSGGWDWAPYTTTASAGIPTFTKGIWKSVYVAEIATVAVKHMVPQIKYLGEYPTSPLNEAAHAGFKVDVKAHLWATAATTGTIAVAGSWGQAERFAVTVPAGDSVSVVSLHVAAPAVKLWWPAGHGAQPLYNLTLSFEPGAADSHPPSATPVATTIISATRKIGFRVFAVVTGNDTNPVWVKSNTNSDGTGRHGMYWRINGAAILAKGANMIPMEELEGRMSAGAHRQLVVNAVDGGMNTLRVWGGGIFLPQVWYDACDELGIMLYHDMQYTKGGHLPVNTSVQEAEIRHNVRRLAHHPSIVLWDGCNECLDETLIFVMTIVVQEDASRSIWPSSPALGWASGVHTLTSIPNGKPLVTRKTGPSLESHGPYQHGVGFPTVNGDRGGPGPFAFSSNIPIEVHAGPTGIQFANVFASEFGASVFSSFESMSSTLEAKHWGIHGGGQPDVCQNGTDNPMRCVGKNPMADRNYPCDNIIEVYFGKSNFDAVGEEPFKQHLWQCMVGQALVIKQNIETRRSQSIFGIIVWQLNEIWPTGGWGSIEYGTVGWTKGQVLGGRWKPLQYWYRSAIFTDVVATCGGDPAAPQCYVSNDLPRPFNGSVTISSIDFASGQERTVKHLQLGMAAGVGATQRFDLGVAVDGTRSLLHAVVKNSAGTVVNSNYIPFTAPKNFVLPKTTVQFTVAPATNPDGSIDIHITADKGVAVYLTFTTLAQGRFSDNAFVMLPGTRTIRFLPIQGFKMADLTSSLRAEHVASYM